MEELLMELFLQLNDEEKDEVIEYIKTLPLNCGECKQKRSRMKIHQTDMRKEVQNKVYPYI